LETVHERVDGEGHLRALDLIAPHPTVDSMMVRIDSPTRPWARWRSSRCAVRGSGRRGKPEGDATETGVAGRDSGAKARRGIQRGRNEVRALRTEGHPPRHEERRQHQRKQEGLHGSAKSSASDGPSRAVCQRVTGERPVAGVSPSHHGTSGTETPRLRSGTLVAWGGR
jgi:hypothetical protein